MAYSLKIAEEKHTLGNTHLKLFEWSSKRDLIAVSSTLGEVTLRRLSWFKVWKLSGRGDGITVKAIAWKPDGTIIAVGYSSGEVVLVEVETGKIVHSGFPSSSIVTSLTWADHTDFLESDVTGQLELMIMELKNSTIQANHTHSKTSPASKFSKIFNILWIGYNDTTIFGYLFGLLPCCEFKISEICGTSELFGEILKITVNCDQSQLTLIIQHISNRKEIMVVNVNTALISHCCNELLCIGLLYQEISEQIELLTQAQRNLHEAWEDALVDLESKMAHYKNSNGENSLAVDLMELLMFGHADMRLERFLINDLTDKGLKRIGQAVELSYTNMQRLLVKQVMVANYTLSQCITQLNGLAQGGDKFGCLGLQTDNCLETFRAVGSFASKVAELQQVIDGSVKYLKTFFRWLYVTILRLAEDAIPAELTSSTQQDVRFIANFLAKDLENDGSVRLDRIGQYLRDEPLSLISNSKTRPWNLLSESTHFSNNRETDMFQPIANSSLTQEFKTLKKHIYQTFRTIPVSVGQTISTRYVFRMSIETLQNSDAVPCFTTLNLTNAQKNSTLVALTSSTFSPTDFYLAEFPGGHEIEERGMIGLFSLESCKNLELAGSSIHSLQFYNEKMLMVLVEKNNHSGNVFLQLRLDQLRAELQSVELLNTPFIDNSVTSGVQAPCLPKICVNRFIEQTSVKEFNNFPAATFSLNSSRKVGVVYSSVKRKIRILDMEVGDDDVYDGSEELTSAPDDVVTEDEDMAVSP